MRGTLPQLPAALCRSARLRASICPHRAPPGTNRYLGGYFGTYRRYLLGSAGPRKLPAGADRLTAARSVHLGPTQKFVAIFSLPASGYTLKAIHTLAACTRVAEPRTARPPVLTCVLNFNHLTLILTFTHPRFDLDAETKLPTAISSP